MPADDHIAPADDREPAGWRTRWAWYSYDLGNTAVEFAIPLYLTIWIVTDLGVKAWIFGIATALSSWAIGLSGPYIGVSADERRTRRQWFIASAIVAAVLLSSLSFLPKTGTAAIMAILVVAMVANYSFQLSSLIYNASMLNAASGSNIVSVSSRGLALSFAGGAIGVAVMEAMVSGRLVQGVSGRSWALLPAAIVFIIFCVPGIFTPKLWQNKTDVVDMPPGKLHQRMGLVWQESARRYKAGWFLGGYFALNSAIMGLTLYLPLHVHAVTGFEGIRLLSMFASVVIMSAAGAGVVAVMRPDKIMVRRIILVGLTLLGLNAFAFSLVSALPLILLFSSLHGLLSGALVPTVRGAFAQTFRSDYQALAFGLFGAVQRVSQGLGALLSPLASAATGSGATSAGIAATGVIALIGVPLFARWRLTETDVADPDAAGAPIAGG